MRQKLTVILILVLSLYPTISFAQSRPPSAKPRTPTRTQQRRADRLAGVINELLKLNPLTPEDINKTERGEDTASEEEEKPPVDDAPLKELIDFWSRRAFRTESDLKPSEKVRQRLLDAMEDRPDYVSRLLYLVPDSPDAHDRLYKLLQESTGGKEEIWKWTLHKWLMHNSRYFRDELIESARWAGEDSGDSLRSLARLDWDTARSLVEALAMANHPYLTPLALTLLYGRTRETGDSTEVESLRTRLKSVVASRSADREARSEAITSLMTTDWEGQQEWIVSLFADPTLSKQAESGDPAQTDSDRASPDGITEESQAKTGTSPRSSVDSDFSYRSLLWAAMSGSPEKWFPTVRDLIGNGNRDTHNGAVRWLLGYMTKTKHQKRRVEVAQILLPWLLDAHWAERGPRHEFINTLVDLKLPEAVPGLIRILETDEELGMHAAAAEALKQYRDPRAIPGLRRALELERDEQNRTSLIAALALSGGFSDSEMAAAIEAYAKLSITDEGAIRIEEATRRESKKTLPLNVSIGHAFEKSGEIPATEGLALKLTERARILRPRRPDLAARLLKIIEMWDLPAVRADLVQRMGEGWVGVDSLMLALVTRESLQKEVGDALHKLYNQGGSVAGVAAVLLADQGRQKDILESKDSESKLALLASARFMRDKLPVRMVGKLLESPNRVLAKAAESYLEVEDSREARDLILARHPGEAYILGSRGGGNPPKSDLSLPESDWEEVLRREVRTQADLEGIYTIIRPYIAQSLEGVVVRIRSGKAELSVYETDGRRKVRWLSNAELGELMSFTSRDEIEDLGAESYSDADASYSDSYEFLASDYVYLRLSKAGGRRIGLDLFGRTPRVAPSLHEQLSGLFFRLSHSGDFRVQYEIEDKIPGVEVFVADDKQDVMTVCAEGREMRVLIDEKHDDLRLHNPFREIGQWYVIGPAGVGGVTEEPQVCRVPFWLYTQPGSERRRIHKVPEPGLRAEATMIDSGVPQPEGVWKKAPGDVPVKLVGEPYTFPKLSPDGKWLVAVKASSANETGRAQLVRRNLQTHEEVPISLPEDQFAPPFDWSDAHGKMLLGSCYYKIEKLAPGSPNYLLDVDTGALEPVKGEFRPLNRHSLRPLQPTGKLNEFWATIADMTKSVTSIGRYNAKNFAFTPVLELPGLLVWSDQIWVDAEAGKLWMTYRGHLLRIPMPRKN